MNLKKENLKLLGNKLKMDLKLNILTKTSKWILNKIKKSVTEVLQEPPGTIRVEKVVEELNRRAKYCREQATSRSSEINEECALELETAANHIERCYKYF